MILKNKKLLILTSLLILLPVPVGFLLQGRFPEPAASSLFTVVGLPLIMLATHWFCILITSLDPGNRGKNRKIQTVVLWIIPILTNLSCCGIYALTLGVEFSPVFWTVMPMGLLFMAIGNYMPKTKMNGTIGIKIPWTYSSEANWNATHRFAGKLWVIGGILIALCGFLPNAWAVGLMLLLMIPMCVIPIFYSRQFYKQERSQGKAAQAGCTKLDKKILKLSAIFMAVFLLFICYILFVGEIRYECNHDHLFIDTNMYTDYLIRYDAIENIEYREGTVPGLRIGGFGSFRLLMGFFENGEFGTYTRYTYYDPESCIVLTVSGKPVVLSAETAAQTHALYETLLEKIG